MKSNKRKWKQSENLLFLERFENYVTKLQKKKKFPAYVILRDTSFRQMEVLRTNDWANIFLRLKVFGKAKLEKYRSEFINAIIEFYKNKSVVKEEERKSF